MHHLKNALTHIRRSPYQAMAAVFTMSLTFFVTAIFVMTAVGFQNVLTNFEKQPQITAYFTDDKSEDEIRALDERLKATGTVERSVYISKQDALKIYQQQNRDDPLLLEMVTADILPASLEVSAKDPADLGKLADIISKENGVEEVVYQKDIVETLIAWTQGIRVIGIGLVGTLLAVSLLVLLTVISMKIAIKRGEIEILELLGATSWYIRWPFLVEGSLYGIVASFFAWGFSYLALLYATPYLNSFLGGIPAFSFTPLFMLALLGGMLTGGIVLGIIGSMAALARFL